MASGLLPSTCSLLYYHWKLFWYTYFVTSPPQVKDCEKHTQQCQMSSVSWWHSPELLHKIITKSPNLSIVLQLQAVIQNCLWAHSVTSYWQFTAECTQLKLQWWIVVSNWWGSLEQFCGIFRLNSDIWAERHRVVLNHVQRIFDTIIAYKCWSMHIYEVKVGMVGSRAEWQQCSLTCSFLIIFDSWVLEIMSFFAHSQGEGGVQSVGIIRSHLYIWMWGQRNNNQGDDGNLDSFVRIPPTVVCSLP